MSTSNLSPRAEIVVREAQSALDSAAESLRELRLCSEDGKTSLLAMSPQHARELVQYIDAHIAELGRLMEGVKSSPDSKSTFRVFLLASQTFNLDTGIRFVREAFIQPRLEGGQALILEAADWFCSEGFQVFVKKSSKNPTGPLVAIHSDRSPAVWKEDEKLKSPSIFPETVEIERGAAKDLLLPLFPVVCLPSSLKEHPEYYPLLSHEVGHAVDNVLGLSNAMREGLGASVLFPFWSGWMREMVADAIGITLSGEAFAVALWRFLQGVTTDRELSSSNAYPPFALRMAFLKVMLEELGGHDPDLLPNDIVNELTNLPQVAADLLLQFRAEVVPLFQAKIFACQKSWKPDQNRVRKAVADDKPFVVQNKFRLVPSVMTLVARSGANVLDRFKTWYQQYRQDAGPQWLSQANDWKFKDELIPSLRPTILGPDGASKKPPLELLTLHNRIVFVGATNKNLLKMLKLAAERRTAKSPWSYMDFFFASDALLENVEYFDKLVQPDGTMLDVRKSAAVLIQERDEVIEELKAYFNADPGLVERGRFLRFNGPTIFGSFWDWDQPYGRIHISAQLPGLDISLCPANDYLWLGKSPNSTYQTYRKYLESLYEKASLLHDFTKDKSVEGKAA